MEPSAAARQTRGPSAAARQAREPSAAARVHSSVGMGGGGGEGIKFSKLKKNSRRILPFFHFINLFFFNIYYLLMMYRESTLIKKVKRIFQL